tara:strand:- start:36 stop:629 length:594 start_codon:yes stop_codon:yes gene_type:complete
MGSLIHHDKKLVWIFLPKCGGTSTENYLYNLGGWTRPTILGVDTHVKIPNGYTVFCIGRNPKDWLESGYRMLKQNDIISFSFYQHILLSTSSDSLLKIVSKEGKLFDWKDYWWHCKLVPSDHIIHYTNIKIFKLENIEEFINWISIFFPSAATESFPHMNKTIFDPNINWTKKTLIKANIKMYKYIHQFGYSLFKEN